ncbi:MAG: hypothetical protein IKJ03_02015 [Mycoplasmataceae bacterium]|nr:hypothetical protein [Mycoplasmataceae bacterium]
MYGKVKNIWDIKSNGGGSSIDTENFAKKNEDNTFTGVNTFENTGSMIKVKTNDNAAFGVEFKNSSDEAVAYVGASQVGNEQKATFYGTLGAIVQTPNKDINFNPGSGDVLNNTSKNWNQLLDNGVVRKKDTSFKKIKEYTSVSQPTTSWRYNDWQWTISGINTEGLHDYLVVLSFDDNKAVNFRASLVWKSGVPESQSQILTVEKSGITFYFQIVLKPNNLLQIYNKKTDGSGNNTTISWIRLYVLRGENLPTKMSSVW